MSGFVALILFVAALFGVGLYDRHVKSSDAYPLTIKRVVTISEKDSGFLVSCTQANNPYPYAEHAVSIYDLAEEKARRCFEKKDLAVSADRKRSTK